MPKLLIAISVAKPKDRKAATSSQNMKKLIEKRVEKDADDTTYRVVTINTKMKLAVVAELINASSKKLATLEGVVSNERYEIDPSKARGRWTIETWLDDDAEPKKEEAKESGDEEPKKKKKKKKGKKSKGE
jgi:hypothetical protein